MNVRKCRDCGKAPLLKAMRKLEGYSANLFQFEHDGTHLNSRLNKRGTRSP